jgi:hypothetical protein
VIAVRKDDAAWHETIEVPAESTATTPNPDHDARMDRAVRTVAGSRGPDPPIPIGIGVTEIAGELRAGEAIASRAPAARTTALVVPGTLLRTSGGVATAARVVGARARTVRGVIRVPVIVGPAARVIVRGVTAVLVSAARALPVVLVSVHGVMAALVGAGRAQVAVLVSAGPVAPRAVRGATAVP